MTVQKVINKLKKAPPEAEVYVDVDGRVQLCRMIHIREVYHVRGKAALVFISNVPK